MTVPATLTNEINSLTTADLIRLHIFVNEKYENLKSIVPNFASARWSILNPSAARCNNRYQSQKARQLKKRQKDATLPRQESVVQNQFASLQAEWGLV